MFNDDIAWQAEKIITAEYADIEEELIASFVKDLASGRSVEDITEWKVRKLREIRAFKAQWERKLEKLTKEHLDAMDGAVEDALKTSSGLDDSVFKKVLDDVAKGTATEAFSVKLKAAVKTCHEAMNLTNTQAIAKMQDDFLQIVNEAYIRVLSGVDTLDGVIRQATNSYAGQGLTVQYQTQSGKLINYSIDAAVRRNVLTTINQSAAELTMERCSEYETDLVQVSSHFGARPEHAVWQGKVYSVSGKTKGYQKLSDATGYGTASGLCGVNCKHTFWPYFAGYSKVDQDIPGLRENREQYELQQKQRYYERTIRKDKRQMRAAKEIGDSDQYKRIKARYTARRDEYLSFLSEHNLTRFRARERA